jgi:hypothetical protein
MQRFDSVENAVGILSYASSVTVHPGFAAVLKARYSDFLVHEGTKMKDYTNVQYCIGTYYSMNTVVYLVDLYPSSKQMDEVDSYNCFCKIHVQGAAGPMKMPFQL